MPSNSPLAIDEEDINLGTKIVVNKGIENDSESKGHGPKGLHLSLERNEFSSTFGLTAEETREFWDMILPEETGIGKHHEIDKKFPLLFKP